MPYVELLEGVAAQDVLCRQYPVSGLQLTAPSLVQEDPKLGCGRVGAEAAGFVRFPSLGIKHLNALFPTPRGLRSEEMVDEGPETLTPY